MRLFWRLKSSAFRHGNYSRFFISIGVVNTAVCLLYVVLFFLYRHKLKNRNNALSLSLINIWRTLLIGGEVFRIFFSAVNFGEQDIYFYQKTLTFLLPLIGCFVLGFVMQDKIIRRAAFGIGIMYMIFAGTGLEIRVGSFHGNNVNIGIDKILTALVLSAGMILLGIHLKRKGER